MAAPRKYPDWVHEAIGRLCNEQGITGTEVTRRLATGLDGHDPINLSEDYVRELARRDRRRRVPGLDTQPLGEAIDTLARRTLQVVATEITRLQAKQGQLDADQILKLARTIKELHPLAQAKPTDLNQQGQADPTPAWMQDLDRTDTTAHQDTAANQQPDPDRPVLTAIDAAA